MSTAQQLGLIGNSVKVQSLPTASAETFGAGNRFYTLIGQQEGYITGHTYHTIVANDVYSWEDVAQAGPAGKDALVYNDTWGLINVGLFNAAIETFNRTPIVGEKVVIFSTENQYALATIESVSETTVGVRFSSPIIYTKGATGPQGPAGTTVYNNLSDIPVINQDLSASGFTPVANTYYRHTGATTDTFTQGVIYLYDTAYHKLGESGGGTTLNKYTYIGRQRNIILSILQNAKSIVSMGISTGQQIMSITPSLSGGQGTQFVLSGMWRDYNDGNIIYVGATSLQSGNIGEMTADDWKINKINSDGTIQNYSWKATNYRIVYYNDTEITGA